MQMVFCGIGGQGILLATRAIGEYALSKGFNVIGSEIHGMAQRGGSVVSHLKIGHYKSPLVMRGEADILLSFDWNEGLMNLPFLKEGGLAVLNGDINFKVNHPVIEELIKGRKIKLYIVDGYKVALWELGNPSVLNVVMLGALSSLREDLFPSEGLRKVIENIIPYKFRDINLKAFDLGKRAEIKEVI
ncbi:MAG: indolepyruvate oxidoreductase subunit beta [Synergistetes bacterium]|nr:indolepyruvate oxidoreductase subunit beta [Synergistota bacterium]MCX8127871.1 indolepyruvate oxidoreductase subunit beta [Synergistota bacterium]MDW8192133.1 indolepyruvate oxidoreductase subunit beta [Synergistota bacterium]